MTDKNTKEIEMSQARLGLIALAATLVAGFAVGFAVATIKK